MYLIIHIVRVSILYFLVLPSLLQPTILNLLGLLFLVTVRCLCCHLYHALIGVIRSGGERRLKGTRPTLLCYIYSVMYIMHIGILSWHSDRCYLQL